MSYFACLFRGKLAQEWSHVWDALVSFSSDLYPAELLDDIERAYEEGLVDPGYIGLEDVQRDLALGKEQVLARLAANPHRRLVKDTAAGMEWWACFQDDRAGRTPAAALPRIENKKPKIGRNEPCPCGSGKKYKRCCGA